MSDTTQNFPGSHDDEITEHVRLPEAGLRELVVRNAQGVIRLRGTERDDVLVHAVKGGHTGSRRYREASLLLEEHEGRIFVRPHIPGGPGWIGLGLPTGFIKRGPGRFDFDIDFDKMNFAFGGDVWFDIEIELPRRTANPNPAISVRNASGEAEIEGVQGGQLSVATSSGEVAINDTTGQLNVATASGDVALRDVGKEVVVTTASGDVHIDAVTGRLTARSASGDVIVDSGTLADLHISTASGDHDVTAAFTSPGPYRFETVSGDVNLALTLPLSGGATEPSARIEFTTVSGDAAILPPFRHAGRKTWETGATPQSGAMIRVKSVSGDLHVRAAGDAGTATEAAPTEPIRTQREGEMPIEPIPPMPPMPPMGDSFAAMGEQIARHAEAVSARAMQQAVEALERAAAKMRPLGTVPDTRPGAGAGRPAPTAPVPEPETSTQAAPAAEPLAAPTLSAEAERQRLDILQALERGEIEIDDAMSRLDALESGVAPESAAPEEPAPAPETENPQTP